MRKIKRISIFTILISLFFSSVCFADLGTINMNAGQDKPNYFTSLGNTCPHPVNCAYGTNFLRLSDANTCGCCTCDGGAVGCTGGAHGYIICGDGTYANGCNCQYTVNTD